MIHVEKFAYLDIDDINANTYIVNDSNNDCVVIDPSVDNDGVINYILKHNLHLKAVLLTHGHFDHMRGVDRLCERFNTPLFVHQLDECMLANSRINGSFLMGDNLVVNQKPNILSDGDSLKILEDDIQVIHTPFHTKGSVCYYLKNNKMLFTGDTLFKNSIGRDDLPNADPRKTYESLNKIKALPKDCKIYPGHGSNTVLESELITNCFLSK